jgi:hypothetical protein
MPVQDVKLWRLVAAISGQVFACAARQQRCRDAQGDVDPKAERLSVPAAIEVRVA